MAYKTLYRLYRPQTFDEVVGQKYVIQTLKNSIKGNHVAHAYLFCGPRGTGKTTVAKLLAKALNCEAEDKPCGKCANCLAIKDGTFPDVIEMDAASNNGVDEVRDLIDKIKYAPVSGKYKVYIIDEVHMMSTSAFNALLKTLEEPPAHVVFILATTDPQKVLPTIISRCQRFDFTSISKQDIIEHLAKVLQKEGITYDEDVLPLIASLSDGGMRDALGILDQTIAYANNNIVVHHVEEIYGIISIKTAIKFINNILDSNYQQILTDISDFDKKGIDIPRFSTDLIDILKDVVIYNKTRNVELLNKLDLDEINSINMMTSNKAIKFIDELVNATNYYKLVKSPIAYFEVVILKLCNIADEQEKIEIVREKQVEIKHITTEEKQTVEEIKEPVKEEIKSVQPTVEVIQEEVKKEDVQEEMFIDEPIQTIEEPVSEPTVSKVDDTSSVSLTTDELLNILVQSSKENKTKLIEKWDTLKRYRLQPKYQKAVSLLSGGSPVAVAENGMILSFNTNSQADLVNQAKSQAIIMEFFKEEFLNKECYFYALSDDGFRQLKYEFVRRRKTHTLPAPHKITPPVIEVVEDKPIEEDEEVNSLKKLFGDSLEVID